MSDVVAEPMAAPPEQLRGDEVKTPLRVGGRNLVPERNWVGKPVPRREDGRLLRGEARYGDDLQIDALPLRSCAAPMRTRVFGACRMSGPVHIRRSSTVSTAR